MNTVWLSHPRRFDQLMIMSNDSEVSPSLSTILGLNQNLMQDLVRLCNCLESRGVNRA